MTPADFKAWFAVFNEAIDGTPTPKQWTRIKAKVAELDKSPVITTGYMQNIEAELNRIGINQRNGINQAQAFYASDE